MSSAGGLAAAPSGCGARAWRLCCLASTGSQPFRRSPSSPARPQRPREVPLSRSRSALLAGLAVVGLLLAPPAAPAAPQVHPLALNPSAPPPPGDARGFYDALDDYHPPRGTPP